MAIQHNVPILNFEFDLSLSPESLGDRLVQEIEKRLSWTKGFCNHFSLSFNVTRPEEKRPEFRVKSILGRGDVFSEDEGGYTPTLETTLEKTTLENRQVPSNVRCLPVARSKSFCRKSSVDSLEKIKTVDLHGMNKATALEATLDGLSEAVSGNYSKLVIIHGKGLGRLKCTIHDLLKRSLFIKSFNLDPKNKGRTVVLF